MKKQGDSQKYKMKFINRYDAGEQLSNLIQHKKIKYDLLIALPRGGVPVGKEVADQLDMPMYLLYVKKLGHPNNKEFAIGAISETGLQVNETINLEAGNLTDIINASRRRIKEMKKRFNHEIDIKKIYGKHILLVDDGIATGQSILLALNELRKGDPKSITVASPICPYSLIGIILKHADDLIAIVKPANLSGISMFYEDFHQMTDQEVDRILNKKGYLKRQPVNSVSNG